MEKPYEIEPVFNGTKRAGHRSFLPSEKYKTIAEGETRKECEQNTLNRLAEVFKYENSVSVHTIDDERTLIAQRCGENDMRYGVHRKSTPWTGFSSFGSIWSDEFKDYYDRVGEIAEHFKH